jgi:hypothetical protein
MPAQQRYQCTPEGTARKGVKVTGAEETREAQHTTGLDVGSLP